jgi:hypothetical protein
MLDAGRYSDDLALQNCCNREVKTGSNLAESSKEGNGSKAAVSPMMMMIT